VKVEEARARALEAKYASSKDVKSRRPMYSSIGYDLQPDNVDVKRSAIQVGRDEHGRN
jgi:hypothetical protein